MSAAIEQRNQEATCYVGNLEEKVNEELLWELMLQAGPVVNVFMPKDKVSNKYLGYGFVEYRSEDDADYAIKIMNMIKVHGKPIKVNKASQNKRVVDIGANLFIGNLDPDVDEKLLYDTFSAFGGISQSPKIMRDMDTQVSRGFGFVSFESFEASDMAIECMHGQFLCNRAIQVQYAYMKDSPGERHGTQAERMMAVSTSQQKLKPHTNFAGGQGENAQGQQSGGEGLGAGVNAATQAPGMPAVAPSPAGYPAGGYPNPHMMQPQMDPNMLYHMQMQQQQQQQQQQMQQQQMQLQMQIQQQMQMQMQMQPPIQPGGIPSHPPAPPPPMGYQPMPTTGHQHVPPPPPMQPPQEFVPPPPPMQPPQGFVPPPPPMQPPQGFVPPPPPPPPQH